MVVLLLERAEPLGIERVKAADDAGAIGLWATWTLTLIVLALIGIAVADELAIANPGDDVTLGFAILAFGGPALFFCWPSYCSIARCSGIYRARGRWTGGARDPRDRAAPLTLIVGSRR